MKQSGIIPGLCIILIAIALFAAGCTQTQGGKITPTAAPTPVPTTVPVETPGLSSCGLTTCHGLDVACGLDAPQVCTMLYQIGDKCRKYARCDTTGGSCSLVLEPKFTACKACVEQCLVAAGADSLAASSCEDKC